MEILYSIMEVALILFLVFGAPIRHLIRMFLFENRIVLRYRKPERYYKLAIMQIINLGFILSIFFLFWFFINIEVLDGSVGIVMMPLLYVYLIVMIVLEIKIICLEKIEID